jgi:hypothetical protein
VAASLLINPVVRAEPFDHSDWLFEAKFDGFRAAADTLRGRLMQPVNQFSKAGPFGSESHFALAGLCYRALTSFV